MARPEKLLTARAVAALAEPGMHHDGGGLYLRIDDKGRKSWVYRFMVAGKRRDMGLGSFSDVTLLQARTARDRARDALKQGKDPLAERGASPAPAKIPTFGEVADAYVDEHSHAWHNPKHVAQWRMTLTAHCESFRTKPVHEVSTDDILAVLKPIWQNTPETASRLRGRIENVLDAARALGHIEEGRANPARWKGHLDKLLSARKRLSRGHHPAMPWAEVPTFVAGLRRENSISARALEFTILTAARSGEARLAKAAEFNLDAKVWTVPAERMKAKREHRVPLCGRAVEIVKELLAAFPKAEFVFPGLYEGAPLSDATLLGFMQKRKLPYVVHGFRSSFADWRREATRFEREIAEAALAHVIGDETEAAYSRGDVLDRRRELMQAWADFLSPTGVGSGSIFPAPSQELRLFAVTNVARPALRESSSPLLMRRSIVFRLTPSILAASNMR